MKFVYAILGVVAVLGVVYALAFFGVIPAQKIANKNASARSFLKALHLAKDPPVVKPVVAMATTADLAADDPIKKMADERAQLDSEKAAIDAEKAQVDQEKASTQSTADAASDADSRAKLISIYSTMDPDDLAQIMGHIPDQSVIEDLQAMDEKRAGKILAALPADRAAKLSELMTLPPTPAAPTPAPKTSL